MVLLLIGSTCGRDAQRGWRRFAARHPPDGAGVSEANDIQQTLPTAGWGVPGEGCTGRAPHRRAARRTVEAVDNRTEVREFLVSRRAKITPEQAGLPAGTNRRVSGLRRTEVAALAGMSVEYYSKLERGTLAGVSASVLDAIARALQLDDAERAHLFDLARAADGGSTLMRPRRRSQTRIRT